jgi:hypothetical protein
MSRPSVRLLTACKIACWQRRKSNRYLKNTTLPPLLLLLLLLRMPVCHLLLCVT